MLSYSVFKIQDLFNDSEQQFCFKLGVRVGPLGVQTLASQVKFKGITSVFDKNTLNTHKSALRLLLLQSTMKTIWRIDFFLKSR